MNGCVYIFPYMFRLDPLEHPFHREIQRFMLLILALALESKAPPCPFLTHCI